MYTLDFAEQVEKGLTVLGKHTYLYHPAASENYAESLMSRLLLYFHQEQEVRSDLLP